MDEAPPGDVVGDVYGLLLAGVEAEAPHGQGQVTGVDCALLITGVNTLLPEMWKKWKKKDVKEVTENLKMT